jgi:hypothetical protein
LRKKLLEEGLTSTSKRNLDAQAAVNGPSEVSKKIELLAFNCNIFSFVLEYNFNYLEEIRIILQWRNVSTKLYFQKRNF